MNWHRRHPDWRLLQALNKTWSPDGQRWAADTIMTEWDGDPQTPIVLQPLGQERNKAVEFVGEALAWRRRASDPDENGDRTWVLYPPQPASPDWSFIVPFVVICVLGVLTGVAVGVLL